MKIPCKMRSQISALALILFSAFPTLGQPADFVSLPEQLNDPAFADWISYPGISGLEYGVFYFRKELHLDEKPERFLVHVSADNRYRLKINGQWVNDGPAIGDLNNWNYDTIDISEWLQKGRNIVAVQVWNMGPFRAQRQITHKTAFILQGDTPSEQSLNTDSSWLTFRDPGYFPISHTREQVGGGYIAGATDSLIGALHPWGWADLSFREVGWQQADILGKGNHTGLDTWRGTPWLLQPRSLPAMEQKKEQTPAVLETENLDIPVETLSEQLHFTVPANSKVSLLLDNKSITMGFPNLAFSGGRDSRIKIQYQEALFDAEGRKANRNEWRNKIMKGYYDVVVSDGGKQRVFTPLWIRVFRYVKIEIETRDAPLEIHDFHNLFTAYPLKENAEFLSEDPELERIWEISWRTARLCALETYMDCPYYEQIQYIGDTRIQALISMYVDGDHRLAKNALSQFYNSMQPMGLTKSNHPSSNSQIIPPFSLIFISSVHDYFMLRNDHEFVSTFLPGIRFILSWFLSKIDDTGMLGPLPYWNHVDGGTPEFREGSPPGITEGGSAHMTLLLANTLRHAASMFSYFGYSQEAENYMVLADNLVERTKKTCFDQKRGLMAETAGKKVFSQHTNALAILAGAFDPVENKRIARQIMTDKSLAQATLYFNFYVFQALKKAGRGDLFIESLDQWKYFLDKGFTTFPEHGIESRSDCHAWSSHPMYDLLNITCGVEPGLPGFETVSITPQLGSLNAVQGTTIHPLGPILTTYKRQKNGKLNCVIELPEGLNGTLKWNQSDHKLISGINKFVLD